MNDTEPKYTASVKVMRSHDYCHFEVQLGSTEPLDKAGVDAMRKEAARLADKAVEQYKIAKINAGKIETDSYEMERLRERVARAQMRPESERTPREKAEEKELSDRANYSRPRYDYEDDWQEPADFEREEFENEEQEIF